MITLRMYTYWERGGSRGLQCVIGIGLCDGTHPQARGGKPVRPLSRRMVPTQVAPGVRVNILPKLHSASSSEASKRRRYVGVFCVIRSSPQAVIANASSINPWDALKFLAPVRNRPFYGTEDRPILHQRPCQTSGSWGLVGGMAPSSHGCFDVAEATLHKCGHRWVWTPSNVRLR